ncbi:hypothetical protein H8356DRAFT_1317334 [Neocallimastix lanati (nom. inval.)]|nr:hypothetical protein H8356DRAFT_1317334 [Neocallimastix sp. JGI-2020a]
MLKMPAVNVMNNSNPPSKPIKVSTANNNYMVSTPNNNYYSPLDSNKNSPNYVNNNTNNINNNSSADNQNYSSNTPNSCMSYSNTNSVSSSPIISNSSSNTVDSNSTKYYGNYNKIINSQAPPTPQSQSQSQPPVTQACPSFQQMTPSSTNNSDVQTPNMNCVTQNQQPSPISIPQSNNSNNSYNNSKNNPISSNMMNNGSPNSIPNRNFNSNHFNGSQSEVLSTCHQLHPHQATPNSNSDININSNQTNQINQDINSNQNRDHAKIPNFNNKIEVNKTSSQPLSSQSPNSSINMNMAIERPNIYYEPSSYSNKKRKESGSELDDCNGPIIKRRSSIPDETRKERVMEDKIGFNASNGDTNYYNNMPNKSMSELRRNLSLDSGKIALSTIPESTVHDSLMDTTNNLSNMNTMPQNATYQQNFNNNGYTMSSSPSGMPNQSNNNNNNNYPEYYSTKSFSDGMYTRTSNYSSVPEGNNNSIPQSGVVNRRASMPMLPSEHIPQNFNIRHRGSTDINMRMHNMTTRMVKESPYSRSPELRISHKLAERKRRKEMKELFEELRKCLPINKNSKASKWEILSKAIEHIRNLSKQVTLCQEEIQSLKETVNSAMSNPQMNHSMINNRPMNNDTHINNGPMNNRFTSSPPSTNIMLSNISANINNMNQNINTSTSMSITSISTCSINLTSIPIKTEMEK